jgi:prepilin-type N-terminal cleavage/methylation domain-containing protein
MAATIAMVQRPFLGRPIAQSTFSPEPGMDCFSNTKHRSPSNVSNAVDALETRPFRRALTLMELVVVLAILAALAGILAPLLPNLLRRAHKATDATQTSEVSKAVQLYQASFIGYPDNFDLLTDGSRGFPSYLPTDNAPFGGFVTATQLTSDELAALNRVGIQFVQPLATTTGGSGFHPTMNPYPAGSTLLTNQVAISSATGTLFAVLSNSAINNANPSFLQTVRTDSTARFVVFGVGPRSSMVGQVIQDAPLSVPQNKSFTPDNTYSRVGVVFQVSGREVVRSERARFIAAVALEDDELETTEKDAVGYYTVSRGAGQ